MDLPDLLPTNGVNTQVPESVEDEDDGDDDLNVGDEELISLNDAIHCFGCARTFGLYSEAFDHFRDDHAIDLLAIVRSLRLSRVGFTQLVNLTRSSRVEQRTQDNLMTAMTSVKDSEDHFRPVLENDALLCYDIDEDDVPAMVEEDSVETLKERLAFAEEQVCEMRAAMLRMAERKDAALNAGGGDNGDSSDEVSVRVDKPAPKRSFAQNDEFINDLSYFSSYASYTIHEEMLKDEPRTEAYRNAIAQNADFFKDKVVLDVGCGTGILSLFAARAGARKVYSVDNSDIAYDAIEIVAENFFQDVIEVRKCSVESLKLAESVDIIISEWMGYFLLFESMLDSVLFARDHFMKPNGAVLPNNHVLFMSATDCVDLQHQFLGFWDDVYGFKMSAMKKCIFRDAQVATVSPKSLICPGVPIQEFDLQKMYVSQTQFTREIVLNFTRQTNVIAFVGWFDSTFDKNLGQPLVLSTSPLYAPTHWKQTIFFLNHPVSVSPGEYPVHVTVSRLSGDSRSLSVEILFQNIQYQFRVARS